jgi:hypothetical protein
MKHTVRRWGEVAAYATDAGMIQNVNKTVYSNVDPMSWHPKSWPEL